MSVDDAQDRFAKLYEEAVQKHKLKKTKESRRAFALGALAMVEEQQAMALAAHANDNLIDHSDRSEKLSQQLRELHQAVENAAYAN